MRLPVELTVVEDCHTCKGKALLKIEPEAPLPRLRFQGGSPQGRQVLCGCVEARVLRSADGGVG